MLKFLPLLLAFWTATRLAAAPLINEFHAENIGPILPSTGPIVLPNGSQTVVGIEDADHNSTDWIELHNPGSSPVELAGWALSDDPGAPGKWTFPARTLAPGAYLLVFASGKDRRVPTVELHTNFKLAESGLLLLSEPNGAGGWQVVHQIGTANQPYPKQRPRFSYGYPFGQMPANVAPGFFEIQTPGAQNSATAVTDFVEPPSASVPRGLFTSPQNVTLTTATPGATLIYTLDGSEPTLSHGLQVPAPSPAAPPSTAVPISTTTCLRFRAVKPGLGASSVETHTYLFPTDVLTQSGPLLPPLAWGTGVADWAMDPEVVGHTDPESRSVADDLKTIPTVSLVLDWNDIFGGGTAPGGTKAIYPPAAGVAIEGAERRVSVEWINPNGSKTDPNTARGFQQDGTVEVFGGNSPTRWNSDKLSFKVNFTPDLRYRLYGAGAADRFDNLVLDARYNNVWHYGGGGANSEDQRGRGDYYGDAFVADLQRLMGGAGTHAQPVQVYLNGLYWGLYIAHERPDEHFAAAYLGGEDDEWDVIKHRLPALDDPEPSQPLVAGRLLDPTLGPSLTNHTAAIHYAAMVALVEQNPTAALAKIDVPAFIDYILLNFYFANTDWSHQNWYATYHRTAATPLWRWHSWDAEHIMEAVNHDVTLDGTQAEVIAARGPGYLHEKLKASFAYRNAFADRAHAHLFNGGVLTNARIWALFDERLQTISEALRAESARWGDSRVSARPGALANQPYLRGVEWFARRVWWRDEYFPKRSATANGAPVGSVLAQLRARELYPPDNLAAPVFDQHGGNVAASFKLGMSAPLGGAIYYRLDGQDPINHTAAFTGTRRSDSKLYTGKISIPASGTVKARATNGTTWSALTEAYFTVDALPATAGHLVISKIHYHPAPASPAETLAGFSRADFEFIEVLNIGSQRVSIDGLSFSEGISISPLPGGPRELAPGGRALFVAKKAAFEMRYGTALPIAGEFSFGSNLNNTGEPLTLVAANGSTIVSFSYSAGAAWPSAASGQGPALVLTRPAISDPSRPGSWRQSTTTGGAPGTDERLYFAAWQTLHFPANNPEAGPLDDPDRDGLANLIEFGLGTDPHRFTAASAQLGASLQTFDLGAGPQLYATYSIRRVKAAEELTWLPATSTAPPAWSTSDLTQISPSIDHGDGTETVTYHSNVPFAEDGRRFFRTTVTK